MKNIESTLTKKQIFLSRICFCCASIAYGILLLLSALDVFKAQFSSLILPCFLLVLAILMLVLAFIQQNTLLLWLFPLALLLFVMLMLRLYLNVPLIKSAYCLPLSFALGSIICAIYTGSIKDHLKVILLFFPLAILLFLFSYFKVELKLALPLAIIYLGIVATIYVILNRNKGVKK